MLPTSSQNEVTDSVATIRQSQTWFTTSVTVKTNFNRMELVKKYYLMFSMSRDGIEDESTCVLYGAA